MKNKKWTAVILILTSVSMFGFRENWEPRKVKNNSFSTGESYEYKIKLGFMTIGQATVNVNNKIYSVNNRPCFKVDVIGKTTGISDLLKIKNSYLSYIDTVSILPHKFIYSAREGNYKKDQTIFFDQKQAKAIRIENNNKETFKTPENIQDVVSSYYFLRTIDFTTLKVGQTITEPMFFSDELYHMKVKFVGRTSIETNGKSIKVLELSPILPSNSLFEGQDAIKIWVSDDENKVPLKLVVHFKIGNATMELKKYNGVKHPFKWS